MVVGGRVTPEGLASGQTTERSGEGSWEAETRFFLSASSARASNSATVIAESFGMRWTTRYPRALSSSSSPFKPRAVDGWMSWKRMIPFFLWASWFRTLR